jgi:peptidoglycan/xylan/chitin deacetylase (PgdA/CDA1 family)
LDGGHEIAFHGYSHLDLYSLGRECFEKELRDGERIIYHITRERIKGFRSPVFSLNKETVWVLEVLRKYNYKYDSSVFPVRTPLYGSNSAPIHPYFPSYKDPFIENSGQTELLELPILIRDLGFKRLPAGGGFYLRMFGFKFILDSIHLMNKRGYPAMCYFHPWEISGFPSLNMPFHKKVFSYYGVPCYDGFERLVKNASIAPACEIVDEYGVDDS